MTDATAIPVNIYENERELMVVAPMPGVDVSDISVDVTDDGRLTLHAEQRGAGQERIEYLTREWSYGPYHRTVELPRGVDARRANLAFGNGVLAVTLPKTLDTVPAQLKLDDTGQARGMARGHVGTRGGADADLSSIFSDTG
jgi:HSP20 family molecular chaperone IbpA